ncbi:hypothetical protein FA15DRAFT_565340, partial [Coprinopsis marcescibilis]
RFYGQEGKDTVSSKDFLKDIKICYRSASEEQKTDYIADHLGTNSPAEKWYDGLGGDVKKTWATFEAEFFKQFPPPQEAKRGKEEVERELLSAELLASELGKMVQKGGTDVWAHVAFADRLLQLAKEAGIEKTNECIWQVRDKLPTPLRDKIASTHTSWTAFCDSIRLVDTTAVKDALERDRQLEEVREQLANQKRELQRQTALLEQQRTRISSETTAATAALTAKLNAMSLTTPQWMREGQGSQPSQGYGVSAPIRRQNTTSTSATATRPRPPQEPVTEELRAATRELMALYPHQPATETGVAEYKAQLKRWMEKHPNTRHASHTTGFPLSPRASRICTGECFKCGESSHLRAQCTAPPAVQLPPPEQWWRGHCDRVV